jgi:hypothetical protein
MRSKPATTPLNNGLHLTVRGVSLRSAPRTAGEPETVGRMHMVATGGESS